MNNVGKTRRNFLKTVAAGMTAGALGGIRSASGADKKKYNVLFIGCDDLRTQLSTYGYEQMKTPNFERLAKMGLQFNRAYAQQAECAASRASTLTGCRPDTTGVNSPYTPWFVEEFLPEHPDIGTHFHKNGYYTRYLGKVHDGWDPKLSEAAYHAHPGGHKDGSGLHYADKENLHKGPEEDFKHLVDPWEAADVPDTAYQDGMIAEETINTLRRAAKQDKPFFIAAGFKKPHIPFCAPKKYWDLYKPDELDLSEVAQLDRMTPIFARTALQLKGWKGIYDPDYVPRVKALKMIHAYYACVSYIDAQVGKLLDELKRLKLLESTIIVFWSDHGFHLGDHGSWGKSTNFEWATQVPLYVYVPGQKTAGKMTQALVELVDLYPTLADLCGLDVPEYMEGTSFVPVLEDESITWKQAAFSQLRRVALEGYAVRTKQYRYVRWVSIKSKRPVAMGLYNELEDPDEKKNLAFSGEYSSIMSELDTLIKRGWKSALPEGITNKSNNPRGDDSWYDKEEPAAG